MPFVRSDWNDDEPEQLTKPGWFLKIRIDPSWHPVGKTTTIECKPWVDPNAAMIARDGPTKPKEEKPIPLPISTVKPAIAGLVMDQGVPSHQVNPRFGSAM